MANNNDGQIVLGLDIPKTVSQINADIKKLQGQLDQIKATGALDTSATIKQINAQIATLQAQLNNINIQANVNMNNSTKTSAQQTGQQIGKLISDSAEQAISRVSSPAIGRYFKIDSSTSNQFRTEMEKLVSEWTNAKGKLTDINIQTRTSYDKDADENITRLHQATVTYKNELDEVIKKTIAWRQIGTTMNANGEETVLRGFVEVAGQYSKSLDTVSAKTDTFIDKRKQAVANFEIDLQKIQSRVSDQGASKPIKDQTHIDALETQYNEVNNAIQRLNASTKDTFTDTRIEVEKAIATLENLERQYRNAETTATSLRSKDISTVKSQYSSKLDVLVEKMQSSGVYSSGFQKGADSLRGILDNATDSSGLTQFLNGLDKLEAGYKRAKASADAFNQTQKVGIKVSGLESSISDLQRISPEIDRFEAEINGAKVTIKSLGEDLSKVSTQSDFSVVNEKWKAFTKAAEASGIAIRDFGNVTDSITQKVDKIQLLSKEGKFTSQISSVTSDYNRLSQVTDVLKADFKELNRLEEVLNTSTDADTLINSYEQFNTTLQKVKNSISVMDDQGLMYAEQKKIDNLAESVLKFRDNNTKMSKELRNQFTGVYDKLINGTKLTDKEVKKLTQTFASLKLQVREAGQLGQSFGDKMKNAMQKFGEWGFATGIVTKTTSEISRAVDELINLDNILTEISKTSDLTEQELKKLGDTAFESASKYGKKASDYLTGVQEMYRAGFDNAEEMAELSILAQSAGDMDSTLSNDYILATNAAYKYKGSVEELNKVLDSQNYITNNAAISMKDIADATTETASVAAQYGVEIDELSALIATATANTRESGAEVGTALKSILINLQDTTSKPVADTFDALGISMTKVVDGAETLKTPIELIYELADAYNSLPEGDIMRANILNEIGQKRHANTLAAVLSDVDGLNHMLELYNSNLADNSAYKEAEKSANNWQGSINKLNNSFQDLVQNFANSDAIIKAINMVDSLVKAVDKLGAVGTIGLGAGLFAGFKNIGRPKMFGLVLNMPITISVL